MIAPSLALGALRALFQSMRLSGFVASLIALPLLVACSQVQPGADAISGPGSNLAPSSAAPLVSASPTSDTNPNTDAQRSRAAHALDRLAFGPRPGDLDAVVSLGVEAWIERQLHPESIVDSKTEEAVSKLSVLGMSLAELHTAYPKRKQAKTAGNKASGKTPQARRRASPRDDAIGSPRQITLQLAGAKLLRATQSERQLEAVLGDFWFNHFNVDANKAQTRWAVATYEREAITPHVFGKFRDMLGATAKHPAMLVYLDNWRSVADGAGKGGKTRGLNENYGRELLELHTLGVDGGYTQDDVRSVARAFTGFTVEDPAGAATFVFRPRLHDRDAKLVLGTQIAFGDQRDGDAVLDLLAKHPQTARTLSFALARRFVSDVPPTALVDDLAKTFLDTDGDLRAVYRKLFASPEFWAAEARGAKVKKPLELAASALRAAGADYDGSATLVRRVAQLGEPLYECAPPTGYKDTASQWVNAGGLVNRINFGLDLAAGRIRGVQVDPKASAAHATDASAEVDRVAREVLGRKLSEPTRATILAALQETDPHSKSDYQDPLPPSTPKILGLLVGSPEFQKR